MAPDPHTPAERSDSEAVFHFRANEVPIKALEWDFIPRDGVKPATWSSGDPWLLWIVEIDGRFVWCEALDITFDGGPAPASPVRGSFATIEAAKTAAQADFDVRIRSAIRQPTETELLQLAARIYGLPEHRPEGEK